MKNNRIKENVKRNELLMIILFVAIALVLFRGFGMMGFGSSWGYQMMGNYWSGFGWIFGFLFNILALIVLILFILWLIKKLGEQR